MTQQQTNTQETNWSLVRTQDNEFIIGNVIQMGNTNLLMSPAFFIISQTAIRTEKADLVSLANKGTTTHLDPREVTFSEPVQVMMVANFKWVIEVTPLAIKTIYDSFRKR